MIQVSTRRAIAAGLLAALALAGCRQKADRSRSADGVSRGAPATAAAAAPVASAPAPAGTPPGRPDDAQSSSASAASQPSAASSQPDYAAHTSQPPDVAPLVAAAGRAGRWLVGAVAAAMDSPVYLMACGDAALAEGDSDAARACFIRATQRAPANRDALRGLAIAHVAGKRYEQAIPIYLRLLAEDDQDQTTRFNLAVAYSLDGQLEPARATYERLLRDQPRHVQARYNLAALLHALGKLASARDAWREVLALAPDLASAHASLGEVLMDLSDPQAAAEEFSQAARRQPQEAGHWFNMALACRAAGQLGRSAVAMNRATDLEPRNAAFWRETGLTYLDIYRATGGAQPLRQALDAWGRSLDAHPDQPDVRQWLQTYGAMPASAATTQHEEH